MSEPVDETPRPPGDRPEPSRPLMVVAFARPEVDERFTGLWADRDVQRIALAPLTSKACQKLARHVLGSISAEKAAWIVERFHDPNAAMAAM